MVHIAPLIGAAVFLSGFVAALPTQNYDNSPSNGNNNYGGNSNNNNNNNNYGGNSDNNNNNNNNYGGNSNNNYGGNNNYNPPKKETTTMMDDKKTTMMMDDKKTTMMMDDKKTTTMMDDKKTTTMAPPSYQTPSYGSGKSYWGGKGYEDCVNQCIAQFGNGENGGGSYQPGSATAGTAGSKGTGATHTVIVAPSQGVFRMMPFATNASVGDTILFKWGADGHTVTKSSSLTPCNESNSNPVFASGKQNKDFIFTQVVNDTNPTFYYCGVPTHCEKGMFGVINPTMATPSAPNSFALAMAGMATNSSDLSAYMAYTNNITANNLAASTWGQGIDMNQFPDWAKPLAAENIMFTRGTMAKNADIVKPDNTIDLASHATTPLMLPKDLKDALDNSAAAPANSNAAPADANSSAASSASPASSASSPPASSSSAASSDKKSAAVSVSSPRLLVGAVVVVATFFAL